MKTSIKIKKFWYADVASDGGIGTNWKEVQLGQREASVQFDGSDADVSNYKNVLGAILESSRLKGDKTIVFQLADLTPTVIADFTGGTSTSDSNSDAFYAPENENGAVEMSIKFLTSKNVLWILPRVSFDGYPIVHDDDLHYFQMNGVVLLPEKVGVTSFQYHDLKLTDANDITSFSLAEQTGAATITAGTHTVAIEVANGTVVTALVPTIAVSLGASLDPASGIAQDFTSPVVYSVEAADGTTQNWTVTVTVAA